MALRRFGPWLLALFLAAQIVAVAPLVASRTVHVVGSLAPALDPGSGRRRTANSDGLSNQATATRSAKTTNGHSV
jgi:hypothetical protein